MGEWRLRHTDVPDVLARLDAGEPIADLAAQYDISTESLHRAIARWLARTGRPSLAEQRDAELTEGRRTRADIATRHRVHPRTVREWESEGIIPAPSGVAGPAGWVYSEPWWTDDDLVDLDLREAGKRQDEDRYARRREVWLARAETPLVESVIMRMPAQMYRRIWAATAGEVTVGRWVREALDDALGLSHLPVPPRPHPRATPPRDDEVRRSVRVAITRRASDLLDERAAAAGVTRTDVVLAACEAALHRL